MASDGSSGTVQGQQGILSRAPEAGSDEALLGTFSLSPTRLPRLQGNSENTVFSLTASAHPNQQPEKATKDPSGFLPTRDPKTSNPEDPLPEEPEEPELEPIVDTYKGIMKQWRFKKIAQATNQALEFTKVSIAQKIRTSTLLTA